MKVLIGSFVRFNRNIQKQNNEGLELKRTIHFLPKANRLLKATSNIFDEPLT